MLILKHVAKTTYQARYFSSSTKHMAEPFKVMWQTSVWRDLYVSIR